MSLLGYSYDYISNKLIEQHSESIPHIYELRATRWGYLLVDKDSHDTSKGIGIFTNKQELLEQIIRNYNSLIMDNNTSISKIKKKITKLELENTTISNYISALTKELNN